MAQVLEGARQVFMADGFEGASVDDIAKAANVSKATLYSYFSDKKLLFLQVASAECERQAGEAIEKIDRSAPPRVVLDQVGRHFLRFLTSTFGVQVFRICVAETDRFPELGRQFYASGPGAMRAEMVAYFEAAIARGEMAVEDKPLAADQFAELCKADIWARLVFGVSSAVSDAEIDRIVAGAVDVFMARYGV
jgi:AcrR family transcriptional regulator